MNLFGLSSQWMSLRILFDSSVVRFAQEQHWYKSEKITERCGSSLLIKYEHRETVLIKNV